MKTSVTTVGTCSSTIITSLIRKYGYSYNKSILLLLPLLAFVTFSPIQIIVITNFFPILFTESFVLRTTTTTTPLTNFQSRSIIRHYSNQQQSNKRKILQRQQYQSSTLSMSLFSFFSSKSSKSATIVKNTNNQQSLNVSKRKYTQVISDVDDTLKSSGGVNIGGIALGGIDVQYKRGLIYPGVVEFMFQLSVGPVPLSSNNNNNNNIVTSKTNNNNNNNNNEPKLINSIPKIAILTARAEEFKVLLEIKDTNKLAIAFNKVGTKFGINNWGIGPVLYGSVVEWIFQYNKGLRKFTNFELLIQQDPMNQLLQYIYVGDTGEYDYECATVLLSEYPHLVQAVFLHVVSSETKRTIGTSSSTKSNNTVGSNDKSKNTFSNRKYDGTNTENQEYDPDEEENDGQDEIVTIPGIELINGRPIVYFRTYVGAAVAAVQLGLISIDGLEYIIDCSIDQLTSYNVPQTNSKWIDLYNDIDTADDLLLSVL